jgi:hypothetical protein
MRSAAPPGKNDFAKRNVPCPGAGRTVDQMSGIVESENTLLHGETTLTLLVDHNAAKASASAYLWPSSFPVCASTK